MAIAVDTTLAMVVQIVRMTGVNLVTKRADAIAVVAEDKDVADVDAEGEEAAEEDADVDAEGGDAVGEDALVDEVVAEIDEVDDHAVVCAASVCIR